MSAYLFSWNPDRWGWNDLEDEIKKLRRRGYVDERWSCSNHKTLPSGSRAFLIRQGPRKPNGIVGIGVTTSDPYKDIHYLDSKKMSMYVDIRWHDLRREPVVGWKELQRAPFAGFHWGIRNSGMPLPEHFADSLAALWQARQDIQSPTLAEELPTGIKFTEGAKKTITVNAYERDDGARAACLAKYGYVCAVCDVLLEDRYGRIAREFIHVHHVTPISKIGKSYEVDPVKDLRPVCPNCHAILHRKTPPLSIEQARKRLKTP